MDERDRHELSDQAWAAMQAQIETLRPRRGRPALHERLFFEAVRWMLRTRAPWRDLPYKFGPWQRTYKRFPRWTGVGLWVKLYRAMRGLEQKIGHLASLDSTSVRLVAQFVSVSFVRLPGIIERRQRILRLDLSGGLLPMNGTFWGPDSRPRSRQQTLVI